MACHIVRLPPELLIQCLDCEDMDVIQTWKMRNVSHAFRNVIDDWFRLHVLPITQFEIDWPEYDSLDRETTSGKCFFSTRCTFAGFKDKEKRMALFRDEDLQGDTDAWGQKRDPRAAAGLKRKWEEAMKEYESFDHREGQLIPWTIRVASAVNDSPITGYRINYDKVEIAFPWQAAFEKFWREIDCMQRASNKAIEAFNASPENVNPSQLIEDNVGGQYHDVSLTLARTYCRRRKVAKDARKKARRDIRRRRILEQFKDNPSVHQTTWKEDDPISDDDADSDYGGAFEPPAAFAFEDDFSERRKLKRMNELEARARAESEKMAGEPFAEVFAMFPNNKYGIQEDHLATVIEEGLRGEESSNPYTSDEDDYDQEGDEQDIDYDEFDDSADSDEDESEDESEEDIAYGGHDRGDSEAEDDDDHEDEADARPAKRLKLSDDP